MAVERLGARPSSERRDLHDFAALPDGAPMLFELIEGENLAQVLKRRGPRPSHEAIRIAVQALHGLDPNSVTFRPLGAETSVARRRA